MSKLQAPKGHESIAQALAWVYFYDHRPEGAAEIELRNSTLASPFGGAGPERSSKLELTLLLRETARFRAPRALGLSHKLEMNIWTFKISSSRIHLPSPM